MGPAIIRHNGCEIKEFPVSTKEILGKQIIFSGGGYFRLASYYLLHKWSREAAEKQVCPVKVATSTSSVQALGLTRNAGYLLSYIHPRDLDAGQPMLEGLPLARKLQIAKFGCTSAI